MIAAYPLQWPAGWPRTQAGDHKFGRFGTKKTAPGSSWSRVQDITVTEAVNRIREELGRMGVDSNDLVISTNVRTRLDGLPRSGEREPEDSGAAVYWETPSGDRRVMAIDQYRKVADNLAAIAATLDAMRAIEQHGGAQILDRAFTGFTALPAPSTKRDWQAVLGLQDLLKPTIEDVRAAYRRLASANHPDKGGNHNLMAEINHAYAEACAWCAGAS